METELAQLDIVKIDTTKNVIWMSTDDLGEDPHGSWSVVAIIGRDLLAAKLNTSTRTMCRVPISDVTLVAKYSDPLKYLEKHNGKIDSGEGGEKGHEGVQR